MATGSELIRVENVTKKFKGGVTALNECSLTIARGEVVAIIGPSGSGKSTLLRCLNLLETPTSGHIYFGGVDITDKKVDINLHRRKMGMVFQHFNLFPHKTVMQNITLAPVTLKLKTEDEAKKHGMELLERIGLADKANEYPNMLSGGQKQRISIARVFLKNPKILILDEATSALDTVTEQRIQNAFDKLSEGRTTIIIAHRLSTVRNADRIAVIEDEHIIEMGSHDELMAKNGAYAELCRAQSLDKHSGGNDNAEH